MKLEDIGVFINPEEDGITSDIALEFMPPSMSPVDRSRKQWGRQNCRTTKYGRIENIRGSLEVKDSVNHVGTITKNGFSLPSGTNVTIGWVKDVSNEAIIWFNYNAGGQHGIYRYFPKINAIQTILFRRITGIPDARWKTSLNFSKDHFIHSAFVINETLYWTDNYNPPRSLNIDKAVDFSNALITEWTEISEEHLSWIRKPPAMPTAVYDTDSTRKTNLVRGKLFQFRLRYVYFDYSKSASSPVSKVPLPENDDTFMNTFNSNMSVNNKIRVGYNTGSELVTKVEVLFRAGNDEFWYLYNVIDKEILGLGNNLNLILDFYNDINSTIEEQDVVNRPFDNVPLLSESVDIADGNMAIFANNEIGYDNVDIDVEFSPKNVIENWDTRILDYYVFAPQIIHVRFPIASTVQVGDLIRLLLMAHGTTNHYVFWTNVTNAMLTDINYPTLLINDLVNKINTRSSSTGISANLYDDGTGSPTSLQLALISVDTVSLLNHYMLFARPYKKIKTFKKGSMANLGLVYYDEYGRHGGVNISEDCSVYIPFNTENNVRDNVYVEMDYVIKHEAPSWAKKYQIVYAREKPMFIKFYVDRFYRTHLYQGKLLIRFTDIYSAHMTNNFKEVILKPYIWEKGDRIRFVSRPLNTLTQVVTILSEYIDIEIEGEVAYDPGSGDVQCLVISDFDYISKSIDRYSIIEIYRPSKLDIDVSRIYYEVGEVGTVTYRGGKYCHDSINGMQNQDISLLRDCIGSISGKDCYIKLRSSQIFVFPVEEYNYSDIYDSDSTDIGRINIYNADAKQERYETMLMHTGKFYDLTKVNELHNVDLIGNFEFLDKKYGDITRIIYKGFTLKAFQERKTTSIYINKKVIFNADGEEQIIATDRVFNQIKESFQEYGCINPESIVVSERYIYFFDAINGVTVRDAPNGMIPISSYGMVRYHKDLSEAMTQPFQGATSFIPVRTFVPAIYDGFYDEMWYNAQIYYSDGTFGTVTVETPVFHEGSNKWKTFLFNDSAKFDCMGSIGMVSMLWIDGKPFVLNQINAPYNRHFGSEYKQTIAFCGSGKAPNQMKVFNSLELVTNNNDIFKKGNPLQYWHSDKGVYVPPTSQYPNGMLSSITYAMLRSKENGLYTHFARDINTPSDKDEKWTIINGRELRGNVIEITLQNNANYYVYLLTFKINSTMAFSGNNLLK